ncbi:lipase family protein [Sorangium sp. So ce269]
MKFDSIENAGIEKSRDGTTGIYFVPMQLESYLKGIRPGLYDNKATEIMSFASSWAYSDVSSFAYAMAQRGLPGNDCVSIGIKNDAMLVDVSVLLLQSRNKDVLILCFRGTEPTNTINWINNASGRKESFLSSGKVHGGFHRVVRAVWPILHSLLLAAVERESICERLEVLRGLWLKGCSADAMERRTLPKLAEAPPSSPRNELLPPREKVPALYITGHSLGGAMGVIAAALIYWDDQLYGRYRDLMHGIYTYGQPMVGDIAFACEHKGNIGRLLFRHVYGRDIVPRLPSLTMGLFKHIGREYQSTDEGWALRVRPVRRAITLGLSNIMGGISWIAQDVLPLGGSSMRFSWGHHSPINYMRTSMIARPGAEFDPTLPMSDEF